MQTQEGVVGEGVDLGLQIVKREETLARDKTETSFSDRLQDTIRGMDMYL